MEDIYKQVKKLVIKGLNIRVENLRLADPTESAGHQSSFRIGDKIKFDLYARNDSPFDLIGLHFHVHQMSAIALDENPFKTNLEKLHANDGKLLGTLGGSVISNPDDVASPWTRLDSLCRVKVTGAINLKPVQFEDVEVETINITDS